MMHKKKPYNKPKPTKSRQDSEVYTPLEGPDTKAIKAKVLEFITAIERNKATSDYQENWQDKLKKLVNLIDDFFLRRLDSSADHVTAYNKTIKLVIELSAEKFISDPSKYYMFKFFAMNIRDKILAKRPDLDLAENIANDIYAYYILPLQNELVSRGRESEDSKELKLIWSDKLESFRKMIGYVVKNFLEQSNKKNYDILIEPVIKELAKIFFYATKRFG